MIKVEQIRATGTEGYARTAARPHYGNVIPISAKQPGNVVAARDNLHFALGRKGRRERVRRRMLDGAFITAAVGTAALLWWSTQ